MTRLISSSNAANLRLLRDTLLSPSHVSCSRCRWIREHLVDWLHSSEPLDVCYKLLYCCRWRAKEGSDPTCLHNKDHSPGLPPEPRLSEHSATALFPPLLSISLPNSLCTAACCSKDLLKHSRSKQQARGGAYQPAHLPIPSATHARVRGQHQLTSMVHSKQPSTPAVLP